MARLKKPEKDWHQIRICEAGHTLQPNHELVLTGTGANAYLWVGPEERGRGQIYTFSGQETLRALAKQILKHVPARKKRRVLAR